MRRLIFWLSFVFVTALPLILLGETPVRIELKKVFQLGHDSPFFSYISSVCEDSEKNVYVLDRRAYKIYKFSPSGKILFSIGDKGHGPGDFWWPYFIRSNTDKKIIVCDDQGFITFLDYNGKFLEKIRVPKGLDLKYINNDLYYGWRWERDTIQQILVNRKGQILHTYFDTPRDLFSVSAPDETGRKVMTSYSVDEYTPDLLFCYSKEMAAVAVGSRYEILILNNNGTVKTRITRDIKPERISEKEKKYFTGLIQEKMDLYDSAKKEFIRKIPEYKNYFDRIVMSEKYLMVFRVKKDILNPDSMIPVDVFTIDGEFLGTVQLKHRFMFISETSAYAQILVEDDLLLKKYDYRIIRTHSDH